jgi:hypothetical protein
MIPHDFYFSRGIELTKQRSIPASSIPLNFLMSTPGYEGVTFTQWIQVGYITANSMAKDQLGGKQNEGASIIRHQPLLDGHDIYF